ncbi:MAG: hypothetical protein P8099_20825 [Gemmatimonadota bacterium]
MALAACAQTEPKPPAPVKIYCQMWPGALVVFEGGDFGTNADWMGGGSAFGATFPIDLAADFRFVRDDGGLMLLVPTGAMTGTLVITAGSYGTYDVPIEIVAAPGDSIQPATISTVTCLVPTSSEDGGSGTVEAE